MPTSTLTTKTSTPKLSDLARHVVAPKGAVSTGWPAVEKKCRDLGITFRPWQPDVGRLILAKRADGKYAATIGGTGLSIPRQVGKTFLVGAIIFALCLLRPKLTVIWTAHRVRTAEETFTKMQAFAKRKRIAPHILKIVLGSGEEAVMFRNGSRILFGARESGFGLGFDEVDVLIFDEAQRLRDMTLDDMVPAANQSRQETSALLLFMGTPPRPTDSGEVFKRMRADALEGDEDTGWVEFGSDPDHVFTPLPAPLSAADWKQIAKANPSFPEDTPREAILRMRKKLGADSFDREGAGKWDEIDKTLVMPMWSTCSTPEPPGKPLALGLAMDLDRVWLSLGASMDGSQPHLGAVLRVRVDSGRAKMLAEAHRLAKKHGIPVIIAGGGPADSLVDDLEALGLVRDRDLYRIDFPQYAIACADLYDAVEAKEVAHGSYDELDSAVNVAGWRRSTGDRRVWSRKNGDISMLEAATLAFWGATSTEVSVHSPEAYAF